MSAPGTYFLHNLVIISNFGLVKNVFEFHPCTKVLFQLLAVLNNIGCLLQEFPVVHCTKLRGERVLD